jgi:hypothetical protein
VKIVFIGLEYFTNKTTKILKQFDNKHNYVIIKEKRKILDNIQYLKDLISADCIYSIGGNTKSISLLIARILKKKIIMHWVGTDVLLASKRIREGRYINYGLVHNSIHLCDSDWLRSELHSIGIEAKQMYLPCFENMISSPPPLPKQFSILSYVGKGREKFYGFDKLISVAKRFPQILVRITKINGYSEELPANMKLIGHVDDMLEEMRNCTVFLRLPEHDGMAMSVLEALSLGRYVAYSYDYPGVIKIEKDEDLFSFIEKLYQKYSRNELEINYEGYNFVRDNLNSEKVANNLLQFLDSI